MPLPADWNRGLQWRIQGAQQAHAPLKLDQLCFLVQFFFYIRMLENKAQIARESIKTTLELPGPLSGPWTPAESEFGSALVMCVLAHNLLRPPKWKSRIRPWTTRLRVRGLASDRSPFISMFIEFTKVQLFSFSALSQVIWLIRIIARACDLFWGLIVMSYTPYFISQEQ